MTKRLTKEDRPFSMGVFKPIGHVVVALPDETRAKAAAQALRDDGFAEVDILQYNADEERVQMDSMLNHASDFGGFGYEIQLMRKYQALAREGCSWLVVYTPDDAHAERVAVVAKRFDAKLAERYHRLVVEDLI